MDAQCDLRWETKIPVQRCSLPTRPFASGKGTAIQFQSVECELAGSEPTRRLSWEPTPRGRVVAMFHVLHADGWVAPGRAMQQSSVNCARSGRNSIFHSPRGNQRVILGLRLIDFLLRLVHVEGWATLDRIMGGPHAAPSVAARQALRSAMASGIGDVPGMTIIRSRRQSGHVRRRFPRPSKAGEPLQGFPFLFAACLRHA